MKEKREWKEGGCHCGKVKFKVAGDFSKGIICNCSICTKKGFIHHIVENDEFDLLQGQADLTNYQFGTYTAKHLFCRHCGISSFYVPRSHPNGVSVNMRCLDGIDPSKLTLKPFDGQNWENNINSIA